MTIRTDRPRGFAVKSAATEAARQKRWPSPEQRFWSKVVRLEEGQCWKWLGDKTGDGYGRLRIEGRRVLAHRMSWRIENGEIPRGLQVLHRCDNPECCNPVHLFLGTNQDNVADRDAKGRQARPYGEKAPWAKLKNKDVIEIRRAYAAGEGNQRILAAKFGVARSMVSMIVNGVAWPHLLEGNSCK